jgi:MULE transposase domain
MSENSHQPFISLVIKLKEASTLSKYPMEHDGFKFVQQSTAKATGTKYLSCSNRKGGCTARLILYSNGKVEEKNEHSCVREEAAGVVDVTTIMRQRLQDESVASLNTPPSRVWDKIMDGIVQEHGRTSIKVIPKHVGISLVKNTRTQFTGGDVFRAIESIPARNVSCDDCRDFLQFNVAYTRNGKLQRYIGFGHPDLTRLLRYPKITLFIDGTFKVCPKPFTQCLILMLHDASVDLYVPVLYILLDGKDQETYWNAINLVIIHTDRRLEPAMVTCDFELGLINAIVEQFPTVHIVGCLFHWKQALRRRMLDLGIPREQVSDALTVGKLDVLTLVPIAEIQKVIILFGKQFVNFGIKL